MATFSDQTCLTIIKFFEIVFSSFNLQLNLQLNHMKYSKLLDDLSILWLFKPVRHTVFLMLYTIFTVTCQHAHGEKLFKLRAAKMGYSKPIIVMTLSLFRRGRYLYEATIRSMCYYPYSAFHKKRLSKTTWKSNDDFLVMIE